MVYPVRYQRLTLAFCKPRNMMNLKGLLYVLFFLFIFRVAYGQDQAILKVNSGHSLDVLSVCFSPDETKLATASTDNTIKIWDIATGREIVTLADHIAEVQKVEFTKDGTKLISSSWDRTVKIWDTRTWNLIRTIKVPGPDEIDNSDSFSIFNEKFIAVYAGPVIYVYGIDDGKLVKKHSFFHENNMFDLEVNSNGIAYADARDSKDLLVDLNTGKIVREIEFDVRKVCFTRDGNLMAIHNNKEVQLQETLSGKIVKKADRKAVPADDLQFLPDDKHMAGGSNDTIFVLDISTGKTEIFVVPSEGNKDPDVIDLDSFAFAYSKSGKFVALAIGHPVSITVRDGKGFKELKSFGGDAYTSHRVAFTKDNRHFYSLGEDGYVKKWNLETMRIENKKGPFNKDSQAYSENFEYGLCEVNNSFKVVALESDSITTGAACRDFMISDDGKMRVSVDLQKSTVRISDAQSSKLITTFTDAHKTEGGPVITAISPDKKYVVTSGTWDRRNMPLILWNLELKKKERTLFDRRSVVFLKFIDNNTLMIGQETAEGYFGSKITLLTVPDFQIISEVEVGAQFDFHVRCLTKDGNFGYFGSDYTGLEDKDYPIYKVNMRTGTVDSKFLGHRGEVCALALSADEKFLVSGSGQNKKSVENQLRVWDTGKRKLIKTIATFPREVESIDVSSDNRFIVASVADKAIRLFRFDGTEIVTMVPLKNSIDYIALTPDGYYASTKGARSLVHYTKGKKVYSYEQFDLQYNRPDTVLTRIGLASAELIKSYKRAYLKRLKKMKIDESVFERERSFNIPVVSFPRFTERYFTVKEKTFNFDVAAKDSLYNLASLNVRVNGVPVDGVEGIDLRSKKSKTHTATVSLPMASGSNIVEVTVLNEKGVESLAERFEVVSEMFSKPDLYVVAIGVSDFKDASYNLTYAAKDANDLADVCKVNNASYGNVNVLKLTDKDAVKENLPQIRQFLKQTKPDDEVIAFVASHGLLDDSLNYYIALHDVDFERPSLKGLSYDKLEGLLDGIDARKKILFMDACHSGEVDKEETVVMASAATTEGEIKNRGFKSVKKKKEGIGLFDSFELMQVLFADIRKGSGTVVISSASGTEFAFESPEWKNGVFTYALLEGLKTGKADINTDNSIKVSELRDYVIDKVVELTKGKQHPTTRKENLEFDFNVW
jgi:WD40 repeat protein